MIKTFADRRTQELYATGKVKRLPAELAKRAARKLEYVDLATRLDDLRVPPGKQAPRTRWGPTRTALDLCQRPVADLLPVR